MYTQIRKRILVNLLCNHVHGLEALYGQQFLCVSTAAVCCSYTLAAGQVVYRSGKVLADAWQLNREPVSFLGGSSSRILIFRTYRRQATSFSCESLPPGSELTTSQRRIPVQTLEGSLSVARHYEDTDGAVSH